MGVTTFHSGSRVSLYPLTIRQEDGEFIVGRVETGEFISLPEIGARALELLRKGDTLQEAEARLAAEDGSTVDLQAFAADLLDLGFIAAVNGDPARSSKAARSHLPWLLPRHVRWLFSRPVAAVFFAVLAAAAVTLLLRPDVIPRYGDFFWSPLLSIVIAVNLVLGTLHLGVHELAHLVAARAEGMPAHIRPGTRLHYLVLQTDVSAAWALPRSSRYRIYLAGVLWDLLALSILILALAHAGLPPTGEALLAAWILLIIFGLLGELSFYMRTDIYFVFQDLLHSRNLFHDAQSLLLHHYRLAIRALHPKGAGLPPGPLLARSASERRKVVFYACLLITGTLISLGRYLLIGIPILLGLISQAAAGLIGGFQTGNAFLMLDGGFTLLAVVGMQALFVATFLHGRRRALASVSGTLARLFTSRSGPHRDSPQSDSPPPALAP